MNRPTLFASLALSLVGCGDTIAHESLAARGAQLAQSPTASRSRYNFYACTTCHAVNASDAGSRVLTGAPLAGATRRAGYWNGETLSLREAVERCWVTFLRGIPTDLDGETGSALDAWLQSLTPSDAGTSPQIAYTWPRAIQQIDMDGDMARGATTYQRACAYCHGAVNTGVGRLHPLVSIIPRDTLCEHASMAPDAGGYDAGPGCDAALSPTQLLYVREVVIEKVRHGSFLGYAGVMPPFSTELLSDADLADVLVYMGLPRPPSM